MHELTSRLPTKAAKIRALGEAGYPRARIADFLGISYQHVRNVLHRPQPLAAPAPGAATGAVDVPKYGQAEIDASGAIHLPTEIIDYLRLHRGRNVAWRLEDDEVVIMSAAAGLRRAQAILSNYSKPGDESWTDRFLRERRAMWGEEE